MDNKPTPEQKPRPTKDFRPPIKRVYIDVETGGLDSWNNPLIQCAGIIEIGGEKIESFDFKIAPFEDQVIADSSLEVTGLTREDIAKFENPMLVYNDLTRLLDKYVDKFKRTDKFHFVGYNSTFDDRFMRSFWKRNNDNYYGSYFLFPTIDVCVLAADYLQDVRPTMKGFKLVDVAQHLFDDINPDEAHDAFWDIEVTRRIYKHIKSNTR